MSKRKVAGVPGIDPTLPRVELVLGDDRYYLCFTFGALAAAEAKLRQAGVSANLLHALDLTSMDASRVVPLLYASLVTHQPDIAVEDVARLVTLRNLGAIFDAVARAYGESLAEPSQDAKSHPIEPQP